MKKYLSLALILLGSIAQMPAMANGFVTNTAGVKSFMFTGLTANSPASIKIVGWPRDVTPTPNACGLTIIKPKTGAKILQVAPQTGMMVDAGTLAVQTVPTCSGTTLAEPRSASFKTAEGAVVLVGQAAGPIRVIEEITRTVKANACGMARLALPKYTFTGGWQLEGTSFVVGSQTLFSDDMLGTAEQSICKKVGTQSIKYVPLAP